MSVSTRISTWRKFPIALIGYDIRRWETIGGKDLYISEYTKKFIWGVIKYINNCIPYGPTHLQYKSPFGFLLTWPLCLHLWWTFKPQQIIPNPNIANDPSNPTLTVPGSEIVLYWRFGARWEAETGCYVVPSWYGPGLHWD